MKLTKKEYRELWNLQARLQSEAEIIRTFLANREVMNESGENW